MSTRPGCVTGIRPRIGTRVRAFEDAKAFNKPFCLGALAIRLLMKTNELARKILETHTAVDELQRIYRDVNNPAALRKPELAPETKEVSSSI